MFVIKENKIKKVVIVEKHNASFLFVPGSTSLPKFYLVLIKHTLLHFAYFDQNKFLKKIWLVIFCNICQKAFHLSQALF